MAVIKNLLIRIALYSCIAMVPISCGTRKVQTDISKAGSSDKSKQEIELEKESESKTVSQLELSEIKGKVKENTEKTTVNEYDKDTGALIKATVTEKSGKTASSSDKKSKVRTEAYLRTIEKLKIVTIREVKSYSYDKTKNTQRSNNGIYWMLGAVVGFGILIYALYKYITRVKVALPANV